MNIKTILIVILLLGNSTIANSGRTTFGDSDCGQWVSKRKTNTNNNTQAWLSGFLSGVNVVSNGDVLDKLNSMQQAELFMDNYCQKNPLNFISNGAFDLLIELKNKK